MSGMNEGKLDVFGDTVNVNNVDNSNAVKSHDNAHGGFVNLFASQINTVFLGKSCPDPSGPVLS